MTANQESLNDTDVKAIQTAAEELISNVEKVIVGKRDAITLVLVALLCEGHVLLEDVPGVGKTMLCKAVSKSLRCSFKRVQFTPDLLPSDVTGLNFFNQKSCQFQFLPGPIMANIVLADEINRATPRTQSCLLEAMEERQVTIDAETMKLDRPFLVLATQNPVEQEGTFPLPEAQLDRFLLKVKQGYPTQEEEETILRRFERGNPLDDLRSVHTGTELLDFQDKCRRIFVEDSVREYVVKVVRATRSHKSVRLGASPRAAQGLFQASRAFAAMQGRSYVVPDDVKFLAVPVLSHRLIVNSEARLRGGAKERLVQEIVSEIAAPVL